MYSFTDRGDRELTLRPEGTAPVVRAYLEHGQAREPQPVKLWYLAPMFRYAKGQKRPLPRALAVRRRVARLGRPGRRRRGDRAAGRLVRRARTARRPRAGAQLDRRRGLPPGLPRAARGLSRALPRRALGGLADAPRRQPAAHLRLQGRGRPAASSPARRASPTTSATTAPRTSRRVRAFLDARGVAYRVTPGDGARPRLLRAHRLGVGHPRRRLAGRARSRAAAATTGWPSRSAASACRAWASAAAPSASCSRSRRPGVDAAGARRRLVLSPARTTRRDRAARPARAGARARARRARPTSRAAASRGSCGTPSGCGARVITVCRAGDGERGIVRHGETEIAFGDLVDYVERSVRGQ